MELRLNCPYCSAEMRKIKKDHIVVDRCPNCLGIWLDKGELDKIIIKRKKLYQGEEKDWGQPNIGARPPSEDDDVSLLIGDTVD